MRELRPDTRQLFGSDWQLRSSVGYAVLDNGKILSEKGFEQVREGAEGVKSERSSLTNSFQRTAQELS
jgi:hypothetical protein